METGVSISTNLKLLLCLTTTMSLIMVNPTFVGADDESSDDEHVNVPYRRAGIFTDKVRHSWAYDVTRDNQHLPQSSVFPDYNTLNDSISWPYLMSGYTVTREDMSLTSVQMVPGLCRRFCCPKVESAEHGVFTAMCWSPCVEGQGRVQSRLRCECWRILSKSVPTIPSSFDHVLAMKYETLDLAIYAFGKYILTSTLNQPHSFEAEPGPDEEPGSIHKGTIYYHPLKSYGKLQQLKVLVELHVDGGYRLVNPMADSLRDQTKRCVMCDHSAVSEQNQPTRLIYGLSCRHHVCDECLLELVHQQHPRWPYGMTGRTNKCPQCKQNFSDVLITPFPELSFRVPVVIFFMEKKPIYTEALLNSVFRVFADKISWILVEDYFVRRKLSELYELRRYITVQLERRRTRGQARFKLNKILQSANNCHDHWSNLESFLLEKRPFVKWCYDWTLPLPEQLLNNDADFYDSVLERHLYQVLKLKTKANTGILKRECDDFEHFHIDFTDD